MGGVQVSPLAVWCGEGPGPVDGGVSAPVCWHVSGRGSASVCWHGGRILNGEFGGGERMITGWIGFGVVMSQKSSVIACRGGCFCSGMNFLRNFRLLVVLLPDPSRHTTYWYWSTCCTLIMIPVLSHSVGCGLVWFWIFTWSPTTRGGSQLVCWTASSQLAPLQQGYHSMLGEVYSCQAGWEQTLRALKDALGWG